MTEGWEEVGWLEETTKLREEKQHKKEKWDRHKGKNNQGKVMDSSRSHG